MSDDSDPTLQGHSPINPLPATRSRWPWLLLFVILALVCAGGVYAWSEIATWVPALGRDASGGGTAAADRGALPDILATQQKSEEDLAALDRAVADQQEQLKTIVDQLVALTSMVDALQRAIAAPVPPSVAAAPARPPIARAAPRPRKPPSPASQTSAPASTGGAPSNAAPSDRAD
jgi:uncharacterized coiled-coil protein SlyX